MNHSPSGKPRILVFTLSPPLPPRSGGARYSVNTTAALCDRYEFHLFTIGGEKERAHIAEHQALYDAMFRSVHVEPRALMLAEKPLVKQALHVLTHCYHKLPFWDASYYSAAAVRNARRIVRDRGIDALEIHTAHLAFFKQFLPELPALMVNHNVERDLFPFWIHPHPSRLKAALASFCARISRANAAAVEADNVLGFEEMTFISRTDMERMPAAVNKTWVPLCFPIQERGGCASNAPEASPPLVNALWLGGFWWYPNLDAVMHYVSDIHPLLAPRLAQERMMLHFVGEEPPEALKAIAGAHVKVHGFVEDLDTLLPRMDMLFVPMRVGSGVRVKILEAMASGLAVVSTSTGLEGLSARHEHEVLLADTPEGFANAMIDLARDSAKRRRIALRALDLLRREHDIVSQARAMDGIYRRLVGKCRGNAPRPGGEP